MPDEKTPTPDPSTASGTANERGGGGPLLQVDSLVSGYGKKKVLTGVSVSLSEGEIVAVIGHNGAGKSTLLKAIFGMIPLWAGRILHRGEEMERPEPRRWLHRGLAYVPQGNRVFGDLSIRENLELTASTIQGKADRKAGVDRTLAHYPPLKERFRQRAGTLSGGEKQMLALASAFVLSPHVLLLDEPSLGLAPPLVTEALGRIHTIAHDNGVSVLIVEQKVREVLKIANRVCVLRNGGVSYWGASEGLLDPAKLREAYL